MSILAKKQLKVLNLGLELFTDSLQKQEVEVVQVAWKPSANGDQRLLQIIDRLQERDDQIRAELKDKK